MSHLRTLVMLLLSMTALASAVACGDDDGDTATKSAPTSAGTSTQKASSAASKATIETVDFSFRLNAADFKPGINEITLKNSGTDPHHAQFVQLTQGHTFQELAAALQANPQAPPPPWVVLAGGPAGVQPGATLKVSQMLQAGSYVLLCFLSGADGVPHVNKGMVGQLEVKAEGGNTATLPSTEVKFAASEYKFDGPASIKAGDVKIGFTNPSSAKEGHEMAILALQPGFTVDMLREALASEGPPPAGPPPFTDAGGFQAIAPGGSGVVETNLKAGNYALICFVPSPQGAPHAALGMLAPLTVQ